MIRRLSMMLLSLLFTLSVAVPAQADFAGADRVSGGWIGCFDLGDGPSVIAPYFAVSGERVLGSASIHRDNKGGLPLSQIDLAANHMAFTVHRESGNATFSGTIAGGKAQGSAAQGERQGSFWLEHREPLAVKDFDPLIGHYLFESGKVLLVGRWAPEYGMYFYMDGNRHVMIHPVGPDRFVSAACERITVTRSPSGEIVGLAVEPDGGQAMLAKRVKLYTEERVQFSHGDVTLAGSLLIPPGAGPHPAVILVHGAGGDDREFYRIIGDHLVRHGIAAFIYDKRGTGQSTGSWAAADIPDLAADLEAALRYVRGRPEINPDQVGLWGASQGAWPVAQVASQSRDVAFVIAVSAAGMSPLEQNTWSLGEQVRLMGNPKQLIDAAQKFSKLAGDLGRLGREGKLPLPRNHYLVAMDMQLDSAALWAKVQQPTLLIYGGKDKKVPPEASARLLGQVLEQAGNGDFRIDIYPEANHSMLLGDNGVGLEYIRLTEFAPGYFDAVVDWVQHVIKGTPAVRPASARAPGIGSDTYVAGVATVRWYEKAEIQLSMWGLALVACLSTWLVWPIRFLVNRLRRVSDPPPPGLRWARPVAGLVSGINLLLLLGLVVLALLGDPLPVYGGWPLSWIILSVLALVSAAATLVLPLFAVRIWRSDRWSLTGKLHYALVTLTALLFVPYACYWNLIGW